MNANTIGQLLSAYLQLVDVITPRGAFKGEELLTVGQMRQQTLELLQQLQAESESDAAADKGETKEN